MANITTGKSTNSESDTPAIVRTPPFRIESTATRSRYLKLLIYGDYGVGKTYLAGTAVEVPKLNDVLLINAESGDQTLDSQDYDFDNIDVVTATNFKMVSTVYDFLKLHCSARDSNDVEKLKATEAFLKGITPEEIDEPKRYQTVIVDSLSEVESFCLYQLLGITDTTNLDDEMPTAEWSHYRQNLDMILRLVRKFRDLPMHVIMTCARNYVQDENKRFNYSPALTGKLGSKVQGFMDMVGFYVLGQPGDNGQIPRKLYVQPVGKFSAKCRFSSYREPAFDSPTIKKILASVGLLEK